MKWVVSSQAHLTRQVALAQEGGTSLKRVCSKFSAVESPPSTQPWFSEKLHHRHKAEPRIEQECEQGVESCAPRRPKPVRRATNDWLRHRRDHLPSTETRRHRHRVFFPTRGSV